MNLITKYWKSVHLYVLMLTYGNCICAGIYYTFFKYYGRYPDTSWRMVILFDLSQQLYLVVSFYLIYKNHHDASFFPSHFGWIKGFITISLFVQYSFIMFLFPSPHAWSCTFLFLIIVVFFLDPKLLLLHILGYSLLYTIAFLLHPDKFGQLSLQNPELPAYHLVILVLSGISLVSITYFVQHFLIKAQVAVYENAFLLEKQLDYYQHMELLDKQLRSFRHDINNHFICMDHLMSLKQFDELAEYFSELKTSFSFQDKIHYSGNLIIDSILNYELTRIEDTSIHVTVYGRLPKIETVTSMDLCTLFSNMLSNAIIAVKNAGISGALLSVSFESGSSFFAITIRNQTAPEAAELKRKKQRSANRNHGFGIGKIKEVCSKYDGMFEQNYKDQIMTTRVYLPI